MNRTLCHGLALAAGLFLAAAPALAQTPSGGGLRMPQNLNAYAGASIGMARFDVTCPPGSGCDDSDQMVRVFLGSNFHRVLGAEAAWVKLGDFSRAGGEVDAKALDFVLTAGVPFGADQRHRVFAKAGGAYTRTQVTAAPGTGVQTGAANGWGPHFGAGLEIGMTRNLALRFDADRYRFKLPAGRENIDTYSVGLAYRF